ncbi:nitrous oxide-stimulated promoter family protein [Vibrio gallicus]|uniref:nitrous oxide-stimulated promoter family protein n=1 Tax=Vibrio gallicus TaxID=190897 RepID=UPI0021C361DA|nr:nitrous oxide-stimulated promoter family protein [Vibrio gallicus]
MISIYCRNHHNTIHGLCAQCSDLKEYAKTRLDRCVFGQQKPTCNKCPVHCYKPEQKRMMREVMVYAGPRMLLKHPVLAIRHLYHETKQVPELPKQNVSNRYIRRQSPKT